jgi:hypothetical protein
MSLSALRNPIGATMEKAQPPAPTGIFKPVGHTLIAFDTDEELQSGMAALRELGFADASMVRYAAAEMRTRVEAALQGASPLDNFGYELDLLRAHGKLAQRGCVFLRVHAPTDSLSAQVAGMVRSVRPASAQHYGRLLIQDLTERPPGRMGEEAAPN